MQIKKISAILPLMLLSGCTTISRPPAVFIPAKQITASPSTATLPQQSQYHLRYGSDPALEQAFSRYLR